MFVREKLLLAPELKDACRENSLKRTLRKRLLMRAKQTGKAHTLSKRESMMLFKVVHLDCLAKYYYREICQFRINRFKRAVHTREINSILAHHGARNYSRCLQIIEYENIHRIVETLCLTLFGSFFFADVSMKK